MTRRRGDEYSPDPEHESANRPLPEPRLPNPSRENELDEWGDEKPWYRDPDKFSEIMTTTTLVVAFLCVASIALALVYRLCLRIMGLDG